VSSTRLWTSEKEKTLVGRKCPKTHFLHCLLAAREEKRWGGLKKKQDTVAAICTIQSKEGRKGSKGERLIGERFCTGEEGARQIPRRQSCANPDGSQGEGKKECWGRGALLGKSPCEKRKHVKQLECSAGQLKREKGGIRNRDRRNKAWCQVRAREKGGEIGGRLRRPQRKSSGRKRKRGRREKKRIRQTLPIETTGKPRASTPL